LFDHHYNKKDQPQPSVRWIDHQNNQK